LKQNIFIFCTFFNSFHSVVFGKIYSLNTTKHNYLIKILVTGSLHYIRSNNMFRSSSDLHQVYKELKMQRAKDFFSTQLDPIVFTLLYKTL